MPLPRLALGWRRLVGAIAVSFASLTATHAADKHVLLIGGPPSHKSGEHEHRAGVLLLQKCLADFPGLKVDVALDGWPKDPKALDGVDAVVVYADGGPRHIALADDHLLQLAAVAERGGGIGMLHYAVEPTIEKGQPEFLRWIGGAFEINRSVNPTWEANFSQLPTHPITRGVHPFKIRDEWYFNLRFVDGMKGVTPLLTDIPTTAATMDRKDGPHEGNPEVRAAVARGDRQIVSWAFERPNGGRGFGFTGVHYHTNWANDDFRKFVLNAVVWLAKMDVPADGVKSAPTKEELSANVKK